MKNLEKSDFFHQYMYIVHTTKNKKYRFIIDIFMYIFISFHSNLFARHQDFLINVYHISCKSPREPCFNFSVSFFQHILGFVTHHLPFSFFSTHFYAFFSNNPEIFLHVSLSCNFLRII
jgi:hypothetical protein